jgi:hypothetical protein
LTVTVPTSGRPAAAVPENVTDAAGGLLAGGSLAGGLAGGGLLEAGKPAKPPPPPPPPPPQAPSETRNATANAQRVIWKKDRPVAAGVAKFVFMMVLAVKEQTKESTRNTSVAILLEVPATDHPLF